jgi:hypothetical protein
MAPVPDVDDACAQVTRALQRSRFLQRLLLVLVLGSTCMLIGDGCLTPSISVVSSISGLRQNSNINNSEPRPRSLNTTYIACLSACHVILPNPKTVTAAHALAADASRGADSEWHSKTAPPAHGCPITMGAPLMPSEAWRQGHACGKLLRCSSTHSHGCCLCRHAL